MGFAENITEAVGGGDSSLDNCFGLPYSTRLLIFIVLYILSCVLLVLGNIQLFMMGLYNFGWYCFFANACSLTGSCFLKGPISQIKCMWEPKRRIATVFYLGSLAILFIAIFLEWHVIVVFILGIIQTIAMVYYTLSFVPFLFGSVNRFLANMF
eukprot:GAHX01001104.1.p1 GENE.GAHX01001104.1~~GAHX01001104.1.p1  ORF type:complete len:170 (-),score=22.65 GAHX01001104.1:33-494(-)